MHHMIKIQNNDNYCTHNSTYRYPTTKLLDKNTEGGKYILLSVVFSVSYLCSSENGMSLLLAHLTPRPSDAETHFSLALLVFLSLQICPANLKKKERVTFPTRCDLPDLVYSTVCQNWFIPLSARSGLFHIKS